MKNKNRFFIIGMIIVLFIIINSFGSIIKFTTDYKWFTEIGYTETFLTKLKSQFSIGIPLFIILSVLLIIYLNKLKKKFYIESEIIDTQYDKKIKFGINVSSMVLSLMFTVNIVSALWFEILQYINAESFNIVDPVFGHDISFYVFNLPLINTLLSFIMNILFLLIVITVLFYGYLALKKGIKNVTGQFEDISHFNPSQLIDFSSLINKKFITQIINQISIIGSLLLISLGFKFFLKCYDLLYSQLGRVFGAGYTDIFVTLNLYRVLAVGSVVAAFTFFVGARKKNLKVALVMPATLIIISILGTGLTGVIEKFVVEPDQLSKETKYMEYSINSTQDAYNLKNVKKVAFPADDNLNITDLEKNKDVIQNIKINDQEPLIQVYNQLQGIRPYYVFNDVDVDRYTIDGDYTQVFLSARELDQTRLNEQAKTWVNQYLKYTHGYGVTLSPVNEVTTQGQPEMIIKNIPPTTSTNLKITRPEIYFGEKTNEYVIVNTDEKEFDYPSGSDNQETLYEGSAGIKLSFVNKLLFSIREGSYKLLISNNINKDSRIVINRNILQRVHEIAPFIYYDSNAYLVINQEDGKLYWIIEGFTESQRYPYSQPTSNFIEGMNVNYIRNSVKVVIDAYDGKTDFYVVDEKDPIINTYSKIFKDLFKPISEMPQGIKDHVRYSQSLFNIQADMYRLYHIKNPTVFFGREDFWDISNEKYMDNSEISVGSSYVMFKLPEIDKVEFLLTTQYSPQNKDNMIALLAARNDGDNYGQLILYEFPKTKTIPGPNMIETKIDQDTDISSQLTLWGQKGSSVLRGNTLVMPIENSLLYVEPIYLKSDTEGNFPEMKMVVVSFGDKIVMEMTLQRALDKIFGASQNNEPGKIDSNNPTDNNYENQDINMLIQQANDIYLKANKASKGGDWAAYGEYLKQLENILKQLNIVVNGPIVTNDVTTEQNETNATEGTVTP